MAASAGCVVRLVALTLVAFVALASSAMAAKVELLNGAVRAGSHQASGRAAVVQIDGATRVLTLRSFSVIFWCVPFTQTPARANLVRS